MTRIARVARVLVVLAAFAIAASAQSAADWRVRTIDGRSLEGAITMDAEGLVQIEPREGAQVALRLGELRDASRVSDVDAAAGLHRVWLRSGSSIAVGAVATAAAGGLQFEPWFGGPVELRLHHLAALRLTRGDVEVPTFEADRLAPADASDFLYVVRDGKAQRFSVLVRGVADGQIDFELRGSAYRVPIDEVAGIVFGRATGFAPDRQPEPRIGLRLGTGDRLLGRLLRMGDTDCVVRLDEGPEITVRVAAIRRIDVSSDRLAWLGDLTPRAEQTAALDRIWPWTVDSSPAGGAIRLGGRSYDRGIVMVPRTTLTYDLGGRFDLFATTIGIEDRGGPQAHAVFRILADGKTLHESIAAAGSPATPLELTVSGVRELVLQADFGLHYDLGDLCVFADARLLKQ